MRTFVATKNAGKLAEIRAIFAGTAIEPEVFLGYGDVLEGDDDYLENARLKAQALRAQLRVAGIEAAVLADDSGLEVDALGGRPGVLSARYAGANASWDRRLATLLAELRDVPDAQRSARFVCAMVLLLPDRAAIETLGTVAGRIASDAAGPNGFGYDPIFWYPPRGCTFAALSPDEKNALSHRRRAADALLAQYARH